MKKLTSCVVIILLLFSTTHSQISKQLNLDFEETANGKPTIWQVAGSSDYKIYSDSKNVKNGKYSAVIENTWDTAGFAAMLVSLPHNYDGKQIRLTGLIKAENVLDRGAGFLVRIDPGIAFDNMHDRPITGTSDWREYEITLPLSPAKTDAIAIGVLLSGRGKIWVDNLKIFIDGKYIDDKGIAVYEKPPYPADKDTLFDEGSGIRIKELSPKLISDLEILGRVWGFIKYYHPAIAEGNYNWDYELFRMLPEYLKTNNNKNRDVLLTKWIEKLGPIPSCKTCSPTSAESLLKPDLFWIGNSGLSKSLESKLPEIYINRNQGEHYYVKLAPYVGNAIFKNEKAYENMPYPDDGFRLLSLYKYWNIIQYFFPYKYLTDKTWDEVLKEYIPEFISAKNELEYELAALKLIGEVNDSHANLWDGKNKIEELRGEHFAPFRAEFIENKLVVTDFYNTELSEAAGIKIGDIITHINGTTIESIADSLKPYYPASNESARSRDISPDLLRSREKSITIKIASGNKSDERKISIYPKANLNIYRWYREDTTAKSYRLLDDHIGYVTLANIKDEDIAEIKNAFRNTLGIIIDIRNYPSTFVPFSLGGYFTSKPTPFVKFSQSNLANPGEFILTEPLVIPTEGETYKGKLVVLVNENSQSQAEYTAMAFRAGDNTTIIGSTTAGADGNVSAIWLPGGLSTWISGIGVYYPDGGETQRIGIIPDIEVNRTIKGIGEGKDEVLEKAIEMIKSDISPADH